MKRFDFKLQPLLNYREYLERLAQQMTAKAHMDIKNCEQQIEYLRYRYIESSESLERNMLKGIDAGQFRQHHDFLNQVERDIKDQLMNRKQLVKILEKKLDNLKKRSIDKKVIERLKERKILEYKDEFQKSEQQLQDEIASLTKAREVQSHAK